MEMSYLSSTKSRFGAKLSPQMRCRILANFITIPFYPDGDYPIEILDPYKNYVPYYDRTVNAYERRQYFPKKYQDLIEIANLIKSSKTREEIKDILRSRLPTPRPTYENEILDFAVNLTTNLLVMMQLGSERAAVFGDKECKTFALGLVWNTGPLKENIESFFAHTRTLQSSNLKLDSYFTAQNIERIVGIHIVFSDNLLDQLRLINDDRCLIIFHQGAFLRSQQKGHVASTFHHSIGFCDCHDK